MTRYVLILSILMAIAMPLTAFGQKIGRVETAKAAIAVKKVAILPLLFFKDNDVSENKTAIGAYTSELDAVLDTYGIQRVDQATVNSSWQQLTGQPFSTREYQLPPAEQLVELGKKLGVDYVIFSRLKWHVRSVWVFLGPKTKAEAVVDLWIVDVANSEFALKADGIKGNDTEKEPLWKTGVTLFVAPISIVSGGPETPRMERSGRTALDKALEPWIQKQANSKIGG